MAEQATNWFVRFLKRAVPWLIVFFAALLIGFLLCLFLIYFPTKTRLDQARLDLEQVTALEAEIDQLNSQLTAAQHSEQQLQADYEAIEAELQSSDLHVYLLSALADVYGAQMALADEDAAMARLHLSNTPDTLEMLASVMDPAQQEVATSMQQRLEQALGELESDPYAARADLSVLANSLTQLEVSYFAAP